MIAEIWRSLRGIRADSLVSRGGLVQTFGGLTIFVVVSFSGIGVYMIQNALANPLKANSPLLLAAAFLLALALILLYYLVYPGGKMRRRVDRSGAKLIRPADPIVVVTEVRLLDVYASRKDLPFHHCYVDSVRVRTADRITPAGLPRNNAPQAAADGAVRVRR
jgi:hypothetical protein